MNELPDCSVHLVVTSPPYNLGFEYEEQRSLSEYRDFLRTVFIEVQRVLVPGGRVCLNIVDIGLPIVLPLSSYILLDLIDLGFLYRGAIVWSKEVLSRKPMGTFQSAKNPLLRLFHEVILVFSKDSLIRLDAENKTSEIERLEFLEWTKSVWRFPPETSKRKLHPAPFPLELPKRCIKLFSFVNDVVLDPFCGIGTTCLAAKQLNRRYVGYDIMPKYCEIANSLLEGG